jgi:hypothetical protein
LKSKVSPVVALCGTQLYFLLISNANLLMGIIANAGSEIRYSSGLITQAIARDVFEFS